MSASNMEPSVWLIAGPTASGKSALALRLAEAVDGEVVNADSMQLYAGLNILNASPRPSETARAPHHLYAVADPSQSWSVGVWLRAAEVELRAIHARGRAAIVVGGTGLYFRALTQGLAAIPPIPPRVRQEVESAWAEGGEERVRRALRSSDPVSEAKIAPGDRQRLLRALEVLSHSGKPLGDWHATTTAFLEAGRWRGVVLEPARDALYAVCDRRLAAMATGGALEEVQALLARGLDPSLPAMKALGVPEFSRHILGQTSLSTAIEEAQRSTRRYAKRQFTWFRHQTADWPRIQALEPLTAWSTFNDIFPLTRG